MCASAALTEAWPLVGEMGIKRTAKQVDSALGSIAADILPELQTMVAPLMALSASLHSILLGEFYVDSMSLQVRGPHLLLSSASAT